MRGEEVEAEGLVAGEIGFSGVAFQGDGGLPAVAGVQLVFEERAPGRALVAVVLFGEVIVFVDERLRRVLPVAFLQGTGGAGAGDDFMADSPGRHRFRRVGADSDERADVGEVGGPYARDEEKLVGVAESAVAGAEGEQVVDLAVGEEV